MSYKLRDFAEGFASIGMAASAAVKYDNNVPPPKSNSVGFLTGFALVGFLASESNVGNIKFLDIIDERVAIYGIVTLLATNLYSIGKELGSGLMGMYRRRRTRMRPRKRILTLRELEQRVVHKSSKRNLEVLCGNGREDRKGLRSFGRRLTERQFEESWGSDSIPTFPSW